MPRPKVILAINTPEITTPTHSIESEVDTTMAFPADPTIHTSARLLHINSHTTL
jgi:hypothetical protein